MFRPWRILHIAFAALLAPAVLSGCSSLSTSETQRNVYANIVEGDRQLTLNDPAKARVWFDRAVTLAPKSPETYLGPDGLSGDMTGGVIWSLEQHNDWPDMERYLAAATQIPALSDQWLIWSSLAEAQQQMGETQAARLSYQHQLDAMGGGKSGAMIVTQPDDFQLRHADALWNSGQTALAREDLLRLISHHPDIAAEAQNQLAYSEAVDNTNIPEAMQLATAAVATARDSGYPDEVLGEFLDTLGWAEYRQEQYGAALTDLQEALDYIPREPVSHYHLAEIYQALNQTQAAQIELQRAAFLGPSDFDTKVALREMTPGSSQTPTTTTPAKPAV